MHRRFVLIISLLTLLLPLRPGASIAASSGASPATSAHVSAPAHEIPSLRTRTSRTYAEDGHYVADLYPGSINYQDGSGYWQPIDNALVASSVSGFAVENKANRYHVRFPNDLGKGPVRVETADGWVQFSLKSATGDSGAATVAGASVPGSVHANADSFTLDGATITYAAGNDVMKETVTLASPSAPHTFTYDLKPGPGLTAKQNAGGGIDFLTGSNKLAFSFAPPFMTDASGPLSLSHAVTLKLSPSASGDTVTLTADPKWLADPARKYPVVIDPTVTFTGADQDCYISGSYPTSNYCSAQDDAVGFDNVYGYRAFYQFNVQGSLPNNVTILNAELGLNSYWTANGTSFPVGLYPLTRAWTTAATWNTYNGINTWANAGGDYSGSPTVSTTVTSTAGLYKWYPTQLVQGWVSGTIANDGLILKEPTENVGNEVAFYSTQYTGGSNLWPYLKVAYEPWVGDRPFYTFDGPVNVANGNLYLSTTDLAMPGVGLPLTIGRDYNSANNLSTNYLDLGGIGWQTDMGADASLKAYGDGSVAYYAPSGYQVLFIPNGSGTFLAPPGIEAMLVHNTDGTYDLTDNASQEDFHFSSAGVLLSDADRAGNKLSFTYNGAGQPASITDTQGRTTSFTYGNATFTNNITQITDPAGRTYTYGYSGTGQLTSFTDPAGNVTSYGYNGTNYLTQITDPNGNVTRIAYDTSNRVSSITDGNGKVTGYAYSSGNAGCSGVTTGTVVGYTVVTDPNSHATTYCYDVNGLVLGTIDPAGNLTQDGWTSDNQVQKDVQPSIPTASTPTTTFSYDAKNNPTSVTLPTGASASATFNNASFPFNPNTATDTQGHTASYGYNSQGLVTSVVDANGKTTTINRNSNGTVSSVVDANGHTTSYSYYCIGSAPCPNSTYSGLLYQVTPPSPLGTFTVNGYTSANLPTSETDGKGQTTSYSYDADGRVTAISYADGTSVGYTYDHSGNVTAVTDATGTTTYTYDKDNRLTQETLPSGNTVSYSYDGVGNLLSKQDAAGMTGYGYNTLDELTSVTDPTNAQTTFSYDADGNRTAVSYPNGVSESLQWDGAGELTRIWGATISSTLTSYSYAYSGTLRSSMTDVNSNTTSYGYDLLNRLTSAVTKNSGGVQTASYSYAYDPVGNITSKTVNGTQTTYSYNAADELTQAGSTTYSYDANGALTGASGGNAFSLNAKNQINSITPNGGSAIRMTYSGTGQSGRTGAGASAYQYDGTGISSSSSGTTWSVTLAASQTRVLQGMGVTLTALVNNDVAGSGDVIDIIDQTAGTTVKECTTNAVCSVSVSQSTAVKHTYIAQIDPSGSTTAIASSGTAVITWASSNTGWTVSITAPQATAALNQSVTLTAISNQSVTSSGYQIDFVDRNTGSVIASCTSGTSCSTSVSQSAASTHMYLAKVETSGGATVVAASGTWTVTWAATTYFVSTPNGGVLSERITSGTGAGMYYYLHDGLGSVVALTNSSGAVINSYSYDPYGNTTSLSEQVSSPFRYIGAIWDSSTGLYKMGERYYDPSVGRFTQLDPLGDGYVYAGDNPINHTDPSGLCWGNNDPESSGQAQMNEPSDCVAPDPSAYATEAKDDASFRAFRARVAWVGRWFSRQGIRTTDHFDERLAGRGPRGITVQKALRAYNRGRIYFDRNYNSYIRYDPTTKVAVAVSKPSGGVLLSVFEGNPSPRWNPVRWRP